jgi:hypothetical protein
MRLGAAMLVECGELPRIVNGDGSRCSLLYTGLSCACSAVWSTGWLNTASSCMGSRDALDGPPVPTLGLTTGDGRTKDELDLMVGAPACVCGLGVESWGTGGEGSGFGGACYDKSVYGFL